MAERNFVTENTYVSGNSPNFENSASNMEIVGQIFLIGMNEL
jgi:hypothetical protein